MGGADLGNVWTCSWFFRAVLVLVTVGLAACGDDDGAPVPQGAPALAPIGDQTVQPRRSLVLRLTATDPDGDHVTYSSSALPANAELVPSTGLFVFTPDPSQAGSIHTVSFTVSDGTYEDSERVQIRVGGTVPPLDGGPVLDPIGHHTVGVGSTLTLQHHATDPEDGPVTFSVHPPLPPNASYDSNTGLFTFTPAADQVGVYSFSFIAADAATVDYETVQVTVSEQGAPCAVTTPTGCVPLPTATPTGSPGPSATPAPPSDLTVAQCYTVASGSYTYHYVNVVNGGRLIFLDDGGTIDFRVGSLLVEQGGTVQAGSLTCPFGSAGGKLEIGIWGTDPTNQGTVQDPPFPGIACVGNSGNCFDPSLTAASHYCTKPDPPGNWTPTDPCNVSSGTGNAKFEGYDPLSYDYGDNYFGYKAFAVSYGGSLQLFGRKGVRDADLSPTPQAACDAPADQYDLKQWAALSGRSWTRLDATVAAGDTTLTVDRIVDWAKGDQLVVGTTDWYPSHSEVVQIASAATTPHGKTLLTLAAPLVYAHNGEKYQIPPTPRANAGNPNREVEMRAPVGLLSRSIVIYSLGDTPDEPFPNPQSDDWEKCSFASNSGNPPAHPECYFGGHLIARQGFATFQVQGVELRQLGQGGRMGHYPMHLHLLKSTAYTDAYVKDCSIWDSMDRFVVLHGTHEVTVARNVGFLSIGHGFYLEDATEIENLLCQNLAVSVRGSFDEFFENQPATSPSYRFVPPILDGAQQELDQGFLFGADSLFPVAFWTMNTWNELVGNAANGVYGFGSCYWFLGSGVSGMGMHLTWTKGSNTPADFADFNVAGQKQAPVKRFRGNSCSTATYGLQTTLEVQPTGNTPAQTGFTAATNPYIANNPSQFDRPQARGNFLPVKYGTNPGCASGYPDESQFASNPDYCVTTVIDHFTTSFNHPGADFGSVWLRPMWFVFMNSAITDQLGGGLGFITGGSWTQTPPGYFSMTKNSVFVGSTGSESPDASPMGPDLCPCPSPTPYASCEPACAQACKGANGAQCLLSADGIALFTGGFNPKRMMTIYDGPFYADGSVFTDTQPEVCDTTGPAPFNDPNSCRIYSSSTQPEFLPSGTPTPTGTPVPQMHLVHAAIGWKQPNGFYYPPAFAFRKTGFDASTFRHNVIDQYETYLQGSPSSPTGQPAAFTPLGEKFPGITPIDFSTILNDMDGTLTGWVPRGGTRTSSLSKNAFFNAPSQDAECLSFGVQTSPYEFVSSVIAPLGSNSTGLYVDSSYWGIAKTPAVPIYRQLLLPGDTCLGDQSVCCASGYPDCSVGTVGCTRASFMLGGQGGQAPYLTTNNGVYYIDTNPQEPNPSCFLEPQVFEPGFAAGKSYVLYNLFANENTNVTYQIYVGDDFDTTAGQWVTVQPHVYNAAAGQGGNATMVTPITDAKVLQALNAGVTVNNGVLRAVFDHADIAPAYLFSSKQTYDVCLPRDLCQIDTSTSESCTMQAQPEFLDGNAADYADYQTAVTEICSYWATASAGRKSLPNTPGDDADDPSFADCPAGGCLGYAFTLPAGFTPKPYAQVGAALTGCFDATWNVPMSNVDPACPTPATPNPTAFCPQGTPTITPTPAQTTQVATPTPTAPGLPTSTATQAGAPTSTPTQAVATATASAGGATATPTVPAATPSHTAGPAAATRTPTPTGGPVTTPTPTPVPTPSGALTWNMSGTTVATLTGIPTTGSAYTQGTLLLQDSESRFCTAAGTYPQVQVRESSTELLTVGLYISTLTSGSVAVAALPAVSVAGTYDVVIQTFRNCDSSKPPYTITMPGAITYQSVP